MDRLWGRLIALASLTWLLAAPAGAKETRVALVVANAHYGSFTPLVNPPRDARAVAETLRQLGFKAVEVGTDLSRDQFIRVLQDFEAEADQADWAVIYYAGHGIEVDRQNYLIPVDAKLKSDRHIVDEAVPLERVLAAAAPAKKLRLVVLDACRDNPFIPQMQRMTASRSIGRGLARMEA